MKTKWTSDLRSRGRESADYLPMKTPRRLTPAAKTACGLMLAFLHSSFFILPSAASAATNDLTGALQRGLFEEEANRNLDAAAQAYQAVSAQFDQDRKLAATAIFRLGEVYRKQSRTNEAVAQYERIVREFSDQPTLVTLSRQNLAGLGTTTEAPASPPLTRAARLEQKRLLEEELKLVEQDVAELKKRSDSGHATPADVRAKEREVLKLKQQLAALNVDAEGVPASTASLGPPVTFDEQIEILRIQAMIKNSPDLINAPGDNGLTPLFRAAAAGQLRVARFLLDNGADANGRVTALDPNHPEKRWTPLHGAAAKGHKAMVELLLSKNADVRAEAADGRTPLHLAASKGYQSVVEVLLAHTSDVNAKDKVGTTPLYLAAGEGHASTVTLLLDKQADPNIGERTGSTPLFQAARLGHLNTVKLLLAGKADPNLQDNSGRTALSYAADYTQLETARALLEAKADPNAGKQDLPLHVAINRGELSVTELLLRHGANANQSSKISRPMRGTPLGDFQPGTYSALRLAVISEKPAFVKLLLQYQGDPKEKRDDFPLVLDTFLNSEILKAFLDAGADANANDGQRRYLLIMAAGARDSEAVALLLAHGADVNVRGINDMTPLHYAVDNGYKKTAALLLENKADVNARNVGGFTPLHLSVIKANQEIVELLLTHGADPNIRNNDGLTPLELAKGAPRPLQPPPPGASVRSIPPRMPGQPIAPGSPENAGPPDVVALLRQHGALDDLPDFNRIEVRRPGTGYAATIFLKGTNDWNRFTLLDAVYGKYGPTDMPAGPGIPGAATPSYSARFAAIQTRGMELEMPFPDLHRIVVVRASAKAGQPARRITVDLLLPTGVVDCTKDVPLEFGDVVEIPEREHTLQESPQGITDEELQQIVKCREGKVGLLVRGKRTELQVLPSKGSAIIWNVLTRQEVRSALFSSSDLSRLKVTRRDPASGKQHEWIVDCSGGKYPDLWLRDGDVIEVPDKP